MNVSRRGGSGGLRCTLARVASGVHQQSGELRESAATTMPKPEVTGAVRHRQRQRRPAELSDVIEGEIAEICRDVAVQVKRIRQLQERTEELRMAIREWARKSTSTSDHEPL